MTRAGRDATSEDADRGVRLGSRAEEPRVNGVSKPRLTTARFNIVKALLDAGETGLTGDELAKRSGHGGAVNTLKSLAASDPDWGGVIQLAGKPGGRYRIICPSDRN
jgi:hypothetical protein